MCVSNKAANQSEMPVGGYTYTLPYVRMGVRACESRIVNGRRGAAVGKFHPQFSAPSLAV
jgi:hypothetical protein